MSESATLASVLQRLYDAGYQERPQQVAFMESVTEGLKKREIRVLEAGTGTGKSFGYLLPAMLSKPEDVPLVVATATVNLQQQLMSKDLPALAAILGRDIRYALAKGRGRYLCPHRLFIASSGGQLPLLGASKGGKAAPQLRDKIVELLGDAYRSDRWDGDRDNWQEPIEPSVWKELSTDRNDCLGRRCGFVKECPYFRAREKVDQADVIVANHDLLLADIELGSGYLLPALENSVYVIDEVHQLADKAVSHLSGLVRCRRVLRWLEEVPKFSSTHSLYKTHGARFEKESEKLLVEVKGLLEFFQQTVAAGKFDGNTWRLDTIEKTLDVHLKAVFSGAKKLLDQLEKLQSRFELEDEGDSEVQKCRVQYGVWSSICDQLVYCLTLLTKENEDDRPPVAKWVEQYVGFETDFTLHAVPSSVAATLANIIWKRCEHGAILCSATITSLGTFNRFQNQAGLKYLEHPAVVCEKFASPFDYSRSQFIAPSMQHDPAYATREAYEREVIEWLPRLLPRHEGSLVLFTSRAMQLAVFDAMPEAVKAHILLQREGGSRHQLVTDHKRAVDEGSWSVIFGLQSFAEGVDLPGKYCQTLIITKLPFSVPGTPLEEVRYEWIKKQGGKPFFSYTLPQTAIRFNQAVGRLIRTEQDVGQVILLDKRIYSKTYGRMLLKDLPDFSLSINQPIALATADAERGEG